MSKKNLTIFNETYTGVAGFKVKDTSNNEITYKNDINEAWQDEDGYVILDRDGDVGNINSTEFWKRPDEWMPYAKGWNDDGADNCYFVYDLINNKEDLKFPEFYAIYARTSSGQYVVECGYVDKNGNFTVEETYTKNSATRTGNFLPVWDGITPNERYYVVRVSPSSGNHLQFVGFTYLENSVWQTKFSGASITNGGYQAFYQPCIEIYGRLPYYTSCNYENKFRNVPLIHINLIDMISLTNMSSMFEGNFNLKRIDGMKTWDTSLVTAMDYTFYDTGYINLDDIKNWDVKKVTIFSYMLSYTRALVLDLGNWEASSVSNIAFMFRGCKAKKIVLPKYLTGNESQTDLFRECYELNEIDFNGSKIRLNSYTFNSCTNLNLDTSSSSIITSTTTSKTTNMNNEFISNRSIRTIDMRNKDTSAVTTMTDFANGCYSLQSVNFTGCDLSAITNTNANLFSTCPSLIELKGFVHYQSFAIAQSTLMPAENLVEVLTNLPTVSSAKTITLGTTNKNKLIAEQIAIATEKGWTVA